MDVNQSVENGWNWKCMCIGIVAMMITAGACKSKPKLSGDLTPQEALSTFTLPEEFKIELIASEPLLSDPTDMEIDEYGRLYVVEMHGYPLDQSGTGKIRMLTDEDGDGKMDKSTVFAEGLNLPNSIMRWKKGLLVTDAPNLLYYEDADGDGKAERCDTLLKGFALSNPQHNVNSPVYGIDNWIYLAHEGATATREYKEEFGDLGTEVFYPAKPDAPRLPQNAGGRSVRLYPDKYLLETTSSNTQFGQSFDAWGRRLLVANAIHVYHEVLQSRYLQRNPYQVVPNATQHLSDHGDACEVFPTTINPQAQLLTDVGVITSACGLTAYLGGEFPDVYNNNDVTFVTESVSNLVHVDRLRDTGASFTASRILERKDFLTSTDSWFRPVNMYVGPDGALYVVDYYRQIIEHPEWMGDEVIESGELYNGTDKGRIYRISRKDAGPADWTRNLKLGDATAAELVEKLASSNSWWRMNAQRLLVDRGGQEALPALEEMAVRAGSPFGRLHALWTLDGLSALRPGLIIQALKDSVAGVRENAIRMAEHHLSNADVVSALLSLKQDNDAKVRFQLLCTLGFVNSANAADVRNELLFRDLNDKWVQIAALSANATQAASLLTVVMEKYQPQMPAYASLVQRLSAIVAMVDNPASVRRLVEKATEPGTKEESALQAALLEGIAQGTKTTNSVFKGQHELLIKTFFNHPFGNVRKGAFRMLRVIGIPEESTARSAIQQAIAVINDSSYTREQRADAVDFLSLRNPASNQDLLQSLIQPKEEVLIQLAALRTLSIIPDTSVCHYLLSKWETLPPGVQDAALAMFMINPERSEMLLSAIEKGKVQTSSLGWPRTQWLLGNPDEGIRIRARPLLGRQNTEAVIKTYQASLDKKGDPQKGKIIYETNCSLCHKVRGKAGVDYGPDLGSVNNWSAKAIMDNILSPSASIAPGYDLWSVELNSGEILQGILASETPTAITLRLSPGNEKAISRDEIKQLKALNMSAMPPGLESKISVEDMAHLLAFLKQGEQQ